MTDEQSGLYGLGDDIRRSWQRFLDAFEPHRPELYRYCRHLTRSPWDAEDLAQDVMARSFVTLGTRFHALPNPRAWLFRVASSLWIDRMRRQRRERDVLALPAPDAPAEDVRAAREAAGTVIGELSPQERAAVVLKDVFDFSLSEIATALSTSVGAIKDALHRGRRKLAEPRPEAPTKAPSTSVLDAFCAALNARDLPALTALLLDDAVTEIVGMVTEYGKAEPADPRTGSFAHGMSAITRTETGGVAERYLTDYLGGPPRCEVRWYRGEPLLLFWFDHVDGPAVRTILTVETEGDRIGRTRNYFFLNHVIADVCTELGVRFRVNGYGYW
jgi:RNA polymerase sigma-70 factor, ECF subfamily